MVIHFICRGNAFRSQIAEAYLRSLSIKNLEIISSGTVAAMYKAANEINYQETLALMRAHGIGKFAKSSYADQLTQSRLDGNDLVVCMNRIVYDECNLSYELPANTLVWPVTDLGEQGRVPASPQERKIYAEDVYRQITKLVDQLVATF
jgi:protein-tyrosine-phosphatase